MILTKGVNSICNTRPAVRMSINVYYVVWNIYKSVTTERTGSNIRRDWSS
nr:MAG TPA: hypothetical protein [Herelleviridae sp.]